MIVLANTSVVPDVAILVMAFALGACVGSFLNVVIWRLPRRCLSLVKPGSHCPACKTPIKWHDNVPVFGWLRLRGRCRACGVRISPRYPLVELMTGLLFAAVVWLNVLVPDAVTDWQAWLLAVTHMVFISLMIAAAFIDADLTVIPEEINWGGTAVILLLALANPIHGGITGTGGGSGEKLPEGVEPVVASPIHELTLGPGVDLTAPIDEYQRLTVPLANTEKASASFAVNRYGDGQILLRPLGTFRPNEPLAGMPDYIRVNEVSADRIYRLEFVRTPWGYRMISVGPQTLPGADQARVANQWPATALLPPSPTEGAFVPHLRSLLGALFGALIAGGGMWLLRATATGFLIKKALLHGQGAAMGMGDVKLLMLFGAMLGWLAALASIFIGAALALIVTVPMLMMKKQHLFPFGPFLALAAVVILLLHGPLMVWLSDFYAPLMAGN